MRFAYCVLMATLLAACGDSPTSPIDTPETSSVASVQIIGPDGVGVSDTVQLSAVAMGADGAVLSGRVFTWRSANDSVATVDSAGRVIGRSGGSVAITAATGSISASKHLTVTDVPPEGEPPESEPPDIDAVTFERETPHRDDGHHSRYIIGSNGRFELRDIRASDSTVYRGSWTFATSAGGIPLKERDVMLLDFDTFKEKSMCGHDGIAYLLTPEYLALAYCGVARSFGLEEGVYTTVPGAFLDPSPVQDGRIAFVRDGRIHVANSDGSGVTALSEGPNDLAPAWSPDGQRIAFIRVRDGEESIHLMDADGSNVIQRTRPGEALYSLYSPAWSPDGVWIAYACFSGALDICTMKADDDGTAPTNISRHGGQVSGPSWSPDGMRIAFASDWAAYDFVSDIWVMRPDGSQQTNLRTGFSLGSSLQHQPAWSPDGRQLSYVDCPSWTWHQCSSVAIAVMNADGSSPRRLLATGGFVYPTSATYAEFTHPTWSPDGQLIAFGSHRGIEWVRADGSTRGLILSNGHSPAWRP